MTEKDHAGPGLAKIFTRTVLVRLVGMITLGSGLVNLYSVIGPGLRHRVALLQDIFPIEFLHISRFMTVILGFALVISSVYIFRRRKRAYQIVLILAFSSIIFHLTKSLDYEEALFSLVSLIFLLLARKLFTVKSTIPDLRLGFVSLGIALLLAFGYGVSGFWLLDRREFGIDFNLADSIHKTVNFLSLQEDPSLTPQTHYARWFLDSLYLISVTAIGYSLFALFRPVIYIYRTHPQELALARKIVEKHGRSTLDFFKYWPDKSIFFSPSRNCFLAYGVGVNYALVLGDPVGPEEEIETIIREFKTFCFENGWSLGFHQTLPDFLPVYKKLGFKRLKIGDDAVVDLVRFDLEGREKKDLRHKVNQLEKDGYRYVRYDPPLLDSVLQQAEEVSREWLKIPGRRERGFSLGMFEPDYIRFTPLLAAVDKNGIIQAFVNIIPSYCGEATIDLMRHSLSAPKGIMEYLFVKNILYFKEQGFKRFNMGMAPMSGFQDREEATMEERAIHYFFQRLNFMFSYTGLKQFKAKFATIWEPRYAIYQNTLDLPRHALALTRVSEIS